MGLPHEYGLHFKCLTAGSKFAGAGVCLLFLKPKLLYFQDPAKLQKVQENTKGERKLREDAPMR